MKAVLCLVMAVCFFIDILYAIWSVCMGAPITVFFVLEKVIYTIAGINFAFIFWEERKKKFSK